MTNHEIAYICGFLKELEGHYANASCNDMRLKATPENKEMAEAAERQAMGSSFDGLDISKGFIHTFDDGIVTYLRTKLMAEHNLTDKDVPVIDSP